MRVYRTAPTRAFTIFSNALLRDATISWCAVGLLTYLVSLPNGAKASIRKLSEQRKEGRDRIGSALQELEDARYLRRLTRRDEGASCSRCEPTRSPAVAGFVSAAQRGSATVRQVLRRRC
ncbi:hypothetical protein [Streptomyces sp. NPDC000229]|uniref:hypothetical protein n=1 Tax=Streptomyces sp. NPDC000229 TaxID=3154247 RepID=UPI0033211919